PLSGRSPGRRLDDIDVSPPHRGHRLKGASVSRTIWEIARFSQRPLCCACWLFSSPESLSCKMGISPKVDGLAPIRVFASSKSWIEGNATLQLEQVAGLPGVKTVAAMPDLHPGKYGPVGCAVLAERIHPQLVGSDIGCGMGLFELDVAARKLRLDQLA